MEPVSQRAAAWLVTAWVERGVVRGRITTTPDVSAAAPVGASQVAGVEEICGALRAFLADLEGSGGEGQPASVKQSGATTRR